MEKKKLTRTKPLSTIEEQEKAVELLNQKSTPVAARAVEEPAAELEKTLYSYNVKLDEATEKRVKAHISRTGQNMKGFFQIAIRSYLDNPGG